MSELIVYKSNSLVVSRYDLTEQETKLILYGVAKLNPKLKNPTKKDRTVVIPYLDYAKMMGLDNKLAWHNLNNAILELMQRTIEIVNPDPNVPIEKRVFQWVNSAEFNRRTQSVELVFSDEIQPFLFNLKEFIKYKLKNVRSLNNKYSMRLYEIFLKSLGESKSFEKDIIIYLDEFKSILSLEANYPNYKEFNRRVLKVVIEDINKNSDLKVSMKTQGRPVNTLIFTVEKDTQLDLVQEIENRSEPKSTRPRSNKEQTDKQRVKSIYALLEQQEKALIALNKTELNLLLSMRKKYEDDSNLYRATEKQLAFLDGVIAKYKPM